MSQDLLSQVCVRKDPSNVGSIYVFSISLFFPPGIFLRKHYLKKLASGGFALRAAPKKVVIKELIL